MLRHILLTSALVCGVSTTAVALDFEAINNQRLRSENQRLRIEMQRQEIHRQMEAIGESIREQPLRPRRP